MAEDSWLTAVRSRVARLTDRTYWENTAAYDDAGHAPDATRSDAPVSSDEDRSWPHRESFDGPDNPQQSEVKLPRAQDVVEHDEELPPVPPSPLLKDDSEVVEHDEELPSVPPSPLLKDDSEVVGPFESAEAPPPTGEWVTAVVQHGQRQSEVERQEQQGGVSLAPEHGADRSPPKSSKSLGQERRKGSYGAQIPMSCSKWPRRAQRKEQVEVEGGEAAQQDKPRSRGQAKESKFAGWQKQRKGSYEEQIAKSWGEPPPKPKASPGKDKDEGDDEVLVRKVPTREKGSSVPKSLEAPRKPRKPVAEEMADEPNIRDYALSHDTEEVCFTLARLASIPAFRPMPQPTTSLPGIEAALSQMARRGYRAYDLLPDGSGIKRMESSELRRTVGVDEARLQRDVMREGGWIESSPRGTKFRATAEGQRIGGEILRRMEEEEEGKKARRDE